ncbi:MAG: HU family DNA-binding protein [Oscillospiraceae bacterium]|jgi:DNA-binding protein HU-beta|nr:HU family DNA-binding protein [Oscillospiraceae bacterium]
MTKQDVVDALAIKVQITKKDADAYLHAFFDIIGEGLARGEKVIFTKFGIFEVRERAERKGINPRTKEPMTIPASKHPAFRPASALKEWVG